MPCGRSRVFDYTRVWGDAPPPFCTSFSPLRRSSVETARIYRVACEDRYEAFFSLSLADEGSPVGDGMTVGSDAVDEWFIGSEDRMTVSICAQLGHSRFLKRHLFGF